MAQNGNADARLRLFIERVERLEEEKKNIADDIKDVFTEMKAVGYDAKIVKMVLKRRKMTTEDRQEMEMLLETYENALQLTLPLESTVGKAMQKAADAVNAGALVPGVTAEYRPAKEKAKAA